jgi:hypothetical protein
LAGCGQLSDAASAFCKGDTRSSNVPSKTAANVTCNLGGDVLYLYLEVLPRLKPGVIIHIHDIYFPYIYQRDLLTTLFQSSETALLQALLTYNSHLSILFCLSQLHYDAPEILAEVFPEYVHQSADDGLTDSATPGHFPSSIYLQTA